MKGTIEALRAMFAADPDRAGAMDLAPKRRPEHYEFYLAGNLKKWQEMDALVADGQCAKLVQFAYLNVQDQPKLTWPPAFVVVRAYLDQITRTNGLASAKVTAARDELAKAEKLTGQAQRDALSKLAAELEGEVAGATDQAKVHMVAAEVRALAAAQS